MCRPVGEDRCGRPTVTSRRWCRVFAHADAQDVAAFGQLEHADGHLVVAAERHRGGVHDADAIGQEAIVGEPGEHLGVFVPRRVAVVDAVDLGRLEQRAGVDFHGAQRGRGVGREVGVAGAGGEDDEAPLLEVTDGAAADVGLGDLADLERRHHARRDAALLERVLQRERVDDGGEHAHVVALRAVHAGARALEAAEDVAAADDDADLHPVGVHLGELGREGRQASGAGCRTPLLLRRALRRSA